MTLTVTGGAAGILARVEDMRATADVLDAKGEAARELALRVAAVATHEAVLSSQVLSPMTGGRVLTEVAQAQLPPDGLAWLSVEYKAAAVFLRGSATVYEETDAALAVLDQLVHAGWDTAAFVPTDVSTVLTAPGGVVLDARDLGSTHQGAGPTGLYERFGPPAADAGWRP